MTDYIFTVRIEDGHPVETIHGPACVAVTGYTPEDFASDPHLWIRMVHDEDRAAVQEQARCVLLGQDVQPIEHRILRKDGVLRWVRNTLVPHYGPQGNLLSYDGLISDIHERKEAEEAKAKLEAKLQQARRMEAIGTLAGGIAHDFNNILFAMLGFTELANDDVPEESLARANLDEVLKAGRRAKDLVQQILAFSRQGEQERKPLKIQLIVKEALKLLRASLPSTIEITQSIDKDCGPVLADPSHIHQVIMNLCTNAYHAMRENGGRLEVSLSNVDFGLRSADLEKHHKHSVFPIAPNGLRTLPHCACRLENITAIGLSPGSYVRLAISDTGHGMDGAVMERIFDPYFTTKETGEGTGLGLAVVHGIVKKYCGDIHVYSEPGKGAAFHVYLPRTRSGDVAPETASTVPVPKGNERILLVDDEEQIIHMMRETLERLGYHVTPRTSSLEALDAFRAQPEKFDLDITGQTMPNMTGADLAQKLMSMRPDIPVILCTGFSEVISEEKARAIGIREYIMKPVVILDLGKAIRRALDG